MYFIYAHPYVSLCMYMCIYLDRVRVNLINLVKLRMFSCVNSFAFWLYHLRLPSFMAVSIVMGVPLNGGFISWKTPARNG